MFSGSSSHHRGRRECNRKEQELSLSKSISTLNGSIRVSNQDPNYQETQYGGSKDCRKDNYICKICSRHQPAEIITNDSDRKRTLSLVCPETQLIIGTYRKSSQ